MISLKLCRNILIRLFILLVIISTLVTSPAYSLESEDSQIFISGFNAYQQKDYATTIIKMNEVLEKYPDTPLRDMALFWLSRAYFKNGNQQEAARYMSQFSKEYPDNPLKNTVDEELLALAARYDKGEKLPSGPAKVLAQQEVAERERLAQEQADREALARKQAEQSRLAAAKAEEDRKIAERAEQERLAAFRAEEDRLAGLQKEQERIAAAKAEETRRAAEVAEQQRLARENLEREKAQSAALQKEQEHAAAVKAEEERKAAELKAEATQADMKQVAEQQAELVRQAVAKAERKRLAALKAEEEREIAAKAAKAEKEHSGSLKTEGERQAVVPEAARVAVPSEQKRAQVVSPAKNALREKAIAQYKTILEKYPASTAAVTAAAKLKALGVAVALPPQAVKEPLQHSENSQVLRLEVGQFAGLNIDLEPLKPFSVADRFSIPFEITNQGNGSDSFSLESGFPEEFAAGFYSATSTGTSINQTGPLAPGESFKGFVSLAIPSSRIDGQRISHPIKATSRSFTDVTQSREIKIVAAAPLLRAVVKADRSQLLPGDRIVFHMTVLNVGSITAQNVTLRLNFPPQLDPVDYSVPGFRQELKSALVLDGLQIKSGESREFNLAFQLKEDSLADQELLTRVELINNLLKTSHVFVSNTAHVQQKHAVLVRNAADRLVVIPGQTVNIPFVVINSGNVREKFKVVSSSKDARDTVIFQDVNRDGSRQANEPVITEIGPLAPKEEASVVIEVRTPQNSADGSETSVGIAFSSEGDSTRSSSATTSLRYSRPVLQLAMAGRDGRLKPGEVASFELTINNRGSNLAQVVELQSVLPEQLELVAADPASTRAANGSISWRFKELGAGEKRTVKLSYRIKPGTGMGTNLQITNSLTYEDQLGNRY